MDRDALTTDTATESANPQREYRMTEETQQVTATAPTEEQSAQQQPKPTETVDFWKQKAREQEARAKANADAAKRLADIENASKTEQERAAEALSAAEKRAAAAEAAALRLEIAAEKGLTPTQAKRLVGGTREELEADAAELLATFKPAQGDKSDEVITSLDLGTRGTATAAGDPAADFAKFIGGQLR